MKCIKQKEIKILFIQITTMKPLKKISIKYTNRNYHVVGIYIKSVITLNTII